MVITYTYNISKLSFSKTWSTWSQILDKVYCSRAIFMVGSNGLGSLLFLLYSLFHLFLRWILLFVNEMMLMLMRFCLFSYRSLFFFQFHVIFLYIPFMCTSYTYRLLLFLMSWSARSSFSGAFFILSSSQRPLLILFFFGYSLAILFQTFNNTHFSILLTSHIFNNSRCRAGNRTFCMQFKRFIDTLFHFILIC